MNDRPRVAAIVLAAGPHAGVVVDASSQSLVQAVAGLLDHPDVAREQGRRGRDYVRTHLDMASIARQLESAYSS